MAANAELIDSVQPDEAPAVHETLKLIVQDDSVIERMNEGEKIFVHLIRAVGGPLYHLGIPGYISYIGPRHEDTFGPLSVGRYFFVAGPMALRKGTELVIENSLDPIGFVEDRHGVKWFGMKALSATVPEPKLGEVIKFGYVANADGSPAVPARHIQMIYDPDAVGGRRTSVLSDGKPLLLENGKPDWTGIDFVQFNDEKRLSQVVHNPENWFQIAFPPVGMSVSVANAATVTESQESAPAALQGEPDHSPEKATSVVINPAQLMRPIL